VELRARYQGEGGNADGEHRANSMRTHLVLLLSLPVVVMSGL
jgi:hypothetical protein